VKIFADTLFRLEIDSLKIKNNTDEVFILLSGSENSSISNIKSTIPIHTALILKGKTTDKELGFREKGLA
jgi:hypothetical protein